MARTTGQPAFTKRNGRTTGKKKTGTAKRIEPKRTTKKTFRQTGGTGKFTGTGNGNKAQKRPRKRTKQRLG